MSGLIRLLLLAGVLIVGAYFLGYLPQTASVVGSAPSKAPASQDVEAAKDRPLPANPPASGDELKDRAARAADRFDATLADTALTTKIKAKIALDDTLKSADVSVHTKAGVVTLSGNVDSAAMRDRILQLARETSGIKSLVNEIKVAGKA